MRFLKANEHEPPDDGQNTLGVVSGPGVARLGASEDNTAVAKRCTLSDKEARTKQTAEAERCALADQEARAKKKAEVLRAISAQQAVYRDLLALQEGELLAHLGDTAS